MCPKIFAILIEQNDIAIQKSERGIIIDNKIFANKFEIIKINDILLKYTASTGSISILAETLIIIVFLTYLNSLFLFSIFLNLFSRGPLNTIKLAVAQKDRIKPILVIAYGLYIKIIRAAIDILVMESDFL